MSEHCLITDAAWRRLCRAVGESGTAASTPESLALDAAELREAGHLTAAEKVVWAGRAVIDLRMQVSAEKTRVAELSAVNQALTECVESEPVRMRVLILLTAMAALGAGTVLGVILAQVSP